MIPTSYRIYCDNCELMACKLGRTRFCCCPLRLGGLDPTRPIAGAATEPHTTNTAAFNLQASFFVLHGHKHYQSMIISDVPVRPCSNRRTGKLKQLAITRNGRTRNGLLPSVRSCLELRFYNTLVPIFCKRVLTGRHSSYLVVRLGSLRN